MSQLIIDNKIFQEKYGISNIELLTENLTYENGLAVAKIKVEKTPKEGNKYSYETYTIVDDKGQIIGLNTYALASAFNTLAIKQYGNYFVIEERKFVNDKPVKTYRYISVEKDNDDYEIKTIREDGLPLLLTPNKDITIAVGNDFQCLYSFNKNAFVSKKYTNIKPYNNIFLVNDRITTNEDNPLVDWLVFCIDCEDNIVEGVYSKIEQKIISPSRTKFDYMQLKEKRREELQNINVNDEYVINNILKLK